VNILIELTAGHIMMWCNDVQVTDAGGTAIDIVGPNYVGAEIAKVKYVQIKDSLIMCHSAHAPYKIGYTTHTWNGNQLRLTLNAGTPSFIYSILQWTAPTKVPWYASDLWDKVAQWLTVDKVYSAPAATTFNGKTLSTITRRSNSLLLTYSVGSPGTDDVLTQTSTYSYQGLIAVDFKVCSAAGEYPAACAVKNGRLLLGGSSGEPNVIYGSKPLDFFNFVVFEEIEYDKLETNPNNYAFTATVSTVNLSAISATDILQLHSGDIITGGGFPASPATTVLSVNIAAGTAVLSAAGTSGSQSLIRKWAADDIPEYTHTTETSQQIGPGSAMKLALSTEENEGIQWLVSAQDIVMGTASSEFGMAGASNATNASVALTGRAGSMDLQARYVGNNVLFAQRSGTMIRAWTPDGKSPAINSYAEHILKAGVVAFDYSSDPELALWVVCADGYLYRCGLEGDLPSWTRIKTPGISGTDTIESVAVIQSALGDLVYVIVNRTLSGTKRYIEKLTFNEDILYTDRLYLDCATKYSGGAVTSVACPQFPNGTVVTYFAGSSEATMTKGTATVTTGAITVPSSTLVYLGMPYLARMKTYRLETAETEGLRKAVPSIHFRLYKCGPFTVKWSDDGAKSTDVVTPPLWPVAYTGAIKKTRQSSQLTDQAIIIESSDPWPIGIQTIVPEIGIGQVTSGGQ
jgi:hypothetical protein